jgi:hypothetical protein
LILPYLEQQELYDKIDLTKPWDDPANAAAFETDVRVYRCPASNPDQFQTTYLAVVASDGCFRESEPIALDDITDNRNDTLMVVEVDKSHAVHWMSPHDGSEPIVREAMTAQTPPHRGILQAACADGSVRSLFSELKPATLRALVSIAGGDDEVARNAD